MSANLHYIVCWTETDGIHYCDHEHPTIAEAMECLIPNGRNFIRARDNGVMRSLNDAETELFLEELRRNRARF